MRRSRRRDVGPFGRLRFGVGAVLVTVAVGTVGFMVVERVSPLDAFYRTVGLMTTSGGFEATTSNGGKVLAIGVLVVGIGALFYTLGALAEYVIEGHFGRALARRKMDRMIDQLTRHAIICGFGRVGRRIAREFADAGQPFVVIDKLEANSGELESAGYLYLLGDATQDARLQAAGVVRAQSLLAATDDDTENIAITLSARALAPGLWIVARANRDETEAKLVRAGADRVLSPYTLGGHRMAGLARQPHLMDFLDTTLKSQELDLALTVIEVRAHSPLAGLLLPASVDALPPGMRDSTVIAVRPAGQGPWRTASRYGRKPVMEGDWLVVLGPVDLHVPAGVLDASARKSRRAQTPWLAVPPADRPESTASTAVDGEGQ